jgi:hypothetical protein
MTGQTASHTGFHLSKKQIEVFAAGLYHLAACDGVDESETRIIHEFLKDAGAGELIGSLESLSFDPVSAYQVLGTSWLRRLFLRAALLVIRSDGTVSSEEQEAIEWMAGAFGVEGGYLGLLDTLDGESA